MIDYKPMLKQELEKAGVPVYYELFVDSSTKTPCVTYIEMIQLHSFQQQTK